MYYRSLRRLFSSKVDLKYLEKLESKAKQKGVSLEQLRKSIETTRKPQEITSLKPNPLQHVQLNDLVKLDLLSSKTKKDISEIWNGYFGTRQGFLSAAIDATTFAAIKQNMSKYPVFVLPLPRDQGFEFYYLQSKANQVYLTSLLEFKTHGTNATPHLVITNFEELSDSKDVVLMMSEIQLKPTGSLYLNSNEAQLLIHMMQLFYLKNTQFVEKFHNDPENFDYNELISICENAGYSH